VLTDPQARLSLKELIEKYLKGRDPDYERLLNNRPKLCEKALNKSKAESARPQHLFISVPFLFRFRARKICWDHRPFSGQPRLGKCNVRIVSATLPGLSMPFAIAAIVVPRTIYSRHNYQAG
jgi:hypothetical protein